MAELDPRIVSVGIQIGSELRYYRELAITANGQKFANPNQGECNVTISNLSQEVRDYILTETSPLNANRSRKRLILEAGRESYGTSIVYEGDIFRSDGGTRPDNTISLRCLTGAYNSGNIVTRTAAPQDNLRNIAQGIASDNELSLQFEVPDKLVSNYTHSGSALSQIELLRELSRADVFVDGNILVMKPINTPIAGGAFIVDASVGLQVPRFSEQGIIVSFLFDPRVKLGSEIEVRSETYPAANGRYVIYKLKYNIANREEAFHYTAEARRL